MIATGRIGTVRSIIGYFSYFNRDRKNIRNILAYGGGALMDIGCYLIYVSRLIFAAEPHAFAVSSNLIGRPEPTLLSSAMLDFPTGQSVFTCSTQVVPYQRVQILGTERRIEVEIPFNAPPDKPCRIFVDDGSDFSGRSAEILKFDVCNQYTIQGDLFSRSIRDGAELSVLLGRLDSKHGRDRSRPSVSQIATSGKSSSDLLGRFARSNPNRSLLLVGFETGIEDPLDLRAPGEVRLILLTGQNRLHEPLDTSWEPGAAVTSFQTPLSRSLPTLIRYPLVVRSESISTEPLVPEILR